MSISKLIQLTSLYKNGFGFSSRPICKMVDDKVVGWNLLLTSLIDLAEELEKLGLVYHDCATCYIETKENNR